MTDQTMTDEQRVAFLASLGLGDEAAPVAEVDTEVPAKKAKKAKGDKPKKAKKVKPTKEVTVIDPHTIPVSDIVFDAAMLDGFVLDATDIKQASDRLFQHYKSPTKGERNKFLHRRISEFIAQVKRERNPRPSDGFVKQTVKAGKSERNLAKMMTAAGITDDDLALMLQALADKRAVNS